MGSQFRNWHFLTSGACLVALLASWHLAFGQKPTGDAKLEPSLREHATEMLCERSGSIPSGAKIFRAANLSFIRPSKGKGTVAPAQRSMT